MGFMGLLELRPGMDFERAREASVSGLSVRGVADK